LHHQEVYRYLRRAIHVLLITASFSCRQSYSPLCFFPPLLYLSVNNSDIWDFNDTSVSV